jgi:hypothetical protein
VRARARQVRAAIACATMFASYNEREARIVEVAARFFFPVGGGQFSGAFQAAADDPSLGGTELR